MKIKELISLLTLADAMGAEDIIIEEAGRDGAEFDYREFRIEGRPGTYDTEPRAFIVPRY